jgi:hypothetical protein
MLFGLAMISMVFGQWRSMHGLYALGIVNLIAPHFRLRLHVGLPTRRHYGITHW